MICAGHCRRLLISDALVMIVAAVAISDEFPAYVVQLGVILVADTDVILTGRAGSQAEITLNIFLTLIAKMSEGNAL